jgi:hypothetical protein
VTAAHRRAAAREREAAKVLGVARVHRSRYQAAPDLELVVLPDGTKLSVEVKTRARLPALLRAALAQAARYAPDAVPVAVVSEKGGTALACLELKAFAALVGLAPPPPPPLQASLATEPTTTLEALERKVA